MSQWGKNDQANNSPNWSPALVNKKANTANRDALMGNTTANAFVAGQTVGVYGVSKDEIIAARAEGNGDKPASPGWAIRREGQGGRAGRVHTEVLVAFSSGSMTGDASDDSVYEDYVLSVATQPSEVSLNAAANATGTFAVLGATTPSGGTLTYQWEVDTTGVGNAYANVVSASNTQLANLTVDSTEAVYDGALYRCVISESGSDDVTTDGATLTVTGRTLTEDTSPANVSVNSAANDVATFVTAWSATPANTPAITYQWEVDVAGNGTFVVLAGETSSNLSIYNDTYSAYTNATALRCVADVNGSDGGTSGANAYITIT